MVVDTDVFSFIFNANERAELYRDHVEGKIAFLSFQSVGELLYGAYKRQWGDKRLQTLRNHMKRYGIVPFSEQVAHLWADLRVKAERQGSTVPATDAWVAASALALDCPVVTHNRRHFEPIEGLVVISIRDGNRAH